MPGYVTQLTRTRLVPYLIAGSLLVLTLMSLIPASLAVAQGGKTEVFPVQKAAPATVFIEAPEAKLIYGVNCGLKTEYLNSVPLPR